MGRGRSRFSQKTQGGRTAKYGLTGVPRNSRIAVDFDKYRRGTDVRLGTIVSRIGSQCWIRWDGDDEPHAYPEGDVRYWADSGRARIQQPTRETLITKMMKEKK